MSIVASLWTLPIQQASQGVVTASIRNTSILDLFATKCYFTIPRRSNELIDLAASCQLEIDHDVTAEAGVCVCYSVIQLLALGKQV